LPEKNANRKKIDRPGAVKKAMSERGHYSATTSALNMRQARQSLNLGYRHFLFGLSLWEPDKTDAGQLARQILREIDNLWVFLEHQGVAPTNNCAERALRFGVLWRKRSLGTQSVKGNRSVERILSLKETCRLKSNATFPVLVDCIKAYFNKTTPNLAWI
jgi:transposase